MPIAFGNLYRPVLLFFFQGPNIWVFNYMDIVTV